MLEAFRRQEGGDKALAMMVVLFIISPRRPWLQFPRSPSSHILLEPLPRPWELHQKLGSESEEKVLGKNGWNHSWVYSVDVFCLANMVSYFSLNLKAFRCGVFGLPQSASPSVIKYRTVSVIFVGCPVLKTFMILITIPWLEMENGEVYSYFFPGLI